MTGSSPNFCATCGAQLTPGAKFCHRCGTPVGTVAPLRQQPSGVGNALPWSVAAIALLALVALAAGQRFNRAREPAAETENAPVGAPLSGRAPDIAALTPAERAERLYDRIMGAAERGRLDTVRFFLPMAMAAYESLGSLTADQRYDLGRLGEVGGDAQLASAQADTILGGNPKHLLGLVLATRAARMRNDARAVALYQRRLIQAEATERQKQLPEYLLHQNDIDAALVQARAGSKSGD